MPISLWIVQVSECLNYISVKLPWCVNLDENNEMTVELIKDKFLNLNFPLSEKLQIHLLPQDRVCDSVLVYSVKYLTRHLSNKCRQAIRL